MDKELRILILEDVPADAELEEYTLLDAGLVFTSKVVDQEADFVKALDEFLPDIILSDYDLPTFNGLEALEIAKEKCPDVPFILVTGKVGEEFAIETLKKGVTDYVMKGNIERLVPSINRALEEAKLIKDRKDGEKRIREQLEFLQTLLDTIPNPVFYKDIEGKYLGCNKAFELFTVRRKEEIIGKSVYDMGPKEIADKYFEKDNELFQNPGLQTYEWKVKGKDGTLRDVIFNKAIFHDYKGRMAGLIGVISDITERKLAEEALEKRIVALTRPLDDTKGITFEELFNLDDIQQLQDEFARATGVASIITHPDGTPITAPSGFCRLCKDIIRKTDKGCANCFRSDAMIGQPSAQGPTIQPCMSGGLWDAGAGISVGGRHIANWLIGQVRDATQDEEKMRAYALEIGADEAGTLEAFREVPSMTQEQFQQIARMLFTLANQLSATAYQNVQQARFISERKQVEEALRKEKTFADTIINSMPGIFYLFDENGHFLQWNRNFEIVSGYSYEEMLKMNPLDFFSGEEKKLVGETIQAIFAKGESNVEADFVSKDGSTTPYYFTGLRFISDNRPYLIGMGIDITERKRAEEALRESHLFIEGIINSISVRVFWKNRDLVYLGCNKIFARDAGFENPSDIIGKDDYQMAWRDQADLYRGDDRQVIESGRPKFLIEEPQTTPEGKTIFLLTSKIPLHSFDGKIIGVLGTYFDITELRKAEDALRASEAELHDNYFTQTAINMVLSESLEDIPLELMLQKALNMILSIPWLSFEPIGSIHLVEGETGTLSMKAHYNIPKQQRKSCAYVPFGKCLCGKAAETREIQFADHIDERHDICYEGMQPHGHYVVPILFGGRTLGVIDIYLKEGHIRNRKEEDFLLTIADTLAGIIARKQIEEEKEKLHAQLLQAQKMEVVGRLAGGIAHDFNNILAAIIGYGHILKMKLKEDDPLRSYAENILSLSDRAANLTQSLLAFSRKQIINPRPVALNEIIKRIDYLLSRIIGEDIKLQTLLSEKDLIVMADSGQIEQVLMNLATNARDAMPEGGVLTIGTETVDIDHEFIREHGFGKEGEYALISLTDTGAGMDKETREKIFEPFFTTKEVGKGTGLGLSMVYGVIEQHEGYINVYSEPGSGTTFRIYLPLIEAKVEEIKPEVIQPIETGTETVLLAEDEEAIREFTKKLLEEYGYKVITAASGQEAIDEFKAHKDEIQLLLFDVIMPNRNGKEAYEEIKKIRPDIRALFMSGYPADIIHKHDIIEKGFAYIEKPASPTELLRKIRETLGK